MRHVSTFSSFLLETAAPRNYNSGPHHPDDIAIFLDSSVDGSWKWNDENQCIDVYGDINCYDSKYAWDQELPVQFGKVTGDFICKKKNLYTLKGAPSEVGGNFDCSYNRLESLQDSPLKVGKSFSAEFNNLEFLEGLTPRIGKSLILHNNSLSSLYGCPLEIIEDFNCSKNNLSNLEGSPQKIGGNFICMNNILTTLEGGPIQVGRMYNCALNNLSDLSGLAPKIGLAFDCQENPELSSLKGFTSVLKDDENQVPLSLSETTSLEGLSLNSIPPNRMISVYYMAGNANHFYWNIEGWIKGIKRFPRVFKPFILSQANSLDPIQIIELSKVPQIWPELSAKIGKKAETWKDIGDLFF